MSDTNRKQWEDNKERPEPPRQGPLDEGDVAEPKHVDAPMEPVIPTQRPGF